MRDNPAKRSGTRKRGSRAICFTVLLAGAAIGGQPAGAQEPLDRAPGASEEALFVDVPSVTGASRYEQDPREAPASVTVVTQEDIRRFGYRTLRDVLNNVPGFFTTYDRNYTYLGVRGFTFPGDYNTRVLLLIDGHRVNDNVVDAARVGTEAPIDLGVVQRIEVIRGPASSLYGTNAFYAVINLVTRQGRGLQGAEIRGEGGSFGTYAARALYGRKMQSGVELLVGGAYYRSGGPDLYFSEFDSPQTNGGLAAGLDRDRSGHGFVKLIYQGWTFEGGVQARRKQVPTASFGTLFDDPRLSTRDAHSFAFARYEHTFRHLSRLSVKLGFDRFRYSGAYPYAGAVSRDAVRGDWVSMETQYVQPIGTKHKLVAGTELRLNTRQEQAVYDEEPFVSYLDDRRHSQVWAAFVQHEFHITPSLLLNAGLRFDHYQTFGGTTNPRAALIYAIDRSTTLKGLYGRAFRAPTYYELFYQDDGQTQKTSPSLRPETISSFELVAERQFTPTFRGRVSGYHFDASGLIRLTTDTADGLLVFENLTRVRGTGVEVETDAMLGPLEARASYAFQRVRDSESGVRPVNSPAHLARLGLSAPIVPERLRLSGETRIVGARNTLAGAQAPAFAVVNLTVLGRPTRHGLELRGSVDNIFNRRYADPGGEELVQDVIEQDGRVVRLAARYTF
jgi:iron complex outermembrane receptor protein